MEAVKMLKTLNRMCRSYTCCEDCPLAKSCRSRGRMGARNTRTKRIQEAVKDYHAYNGARESNNDMPVDECIQKTGGTFGFYIRQSCYNRNAVKTSLGKVFFAYADDDIFADTDRINIVEILRSTSVYKKSL